MKESVIEAYLCRAVKKAGGEVRKMRWIGRRGAPDRFVLLSSPFLAILGRIPTNYLWVELKAPGKHLRPEQEREIAKLRKVGCVVLVLDSKEQIDAYFAKPRC